MLGHDKIKSVFELTNDEKVSMDLDGDGVITVIDKALFEKQYTAEGKQTKEPHKEEPIEATGN